MKKIIVLIIIAVIIISVFYLYSQPEIRWEVGKTLQVKPGTSPQIKDSSIKIETIATGINELTTFAFIGNDILYLEKINGDIRLIRDGQVSEKILYHFDVYKTTESGLLGITTKDNFVYIYVSESLDEEGNIPKANNIYEFLWTGEELINKKLINTLPSRNCCHQGGYMVTSPDGEIFATILPTGNISFPQRRLPLNWDLHYRGSASTPTNSSDVASHRLKHLHGGYLELKYHCGCVESVHLSLNNLQNLLRANDKS